MYAPVSGWTRRCRTSTPKISTPLLTDVELTIDGVDTEEIYPTPLPDIFAGSQLVIVGHYKDGGWAMIELKGKIDGKETTYVYEGQPFASDETVSTESLPRLWATRKIGYYPMNQIRLQGEQKELDRGDRRPEHPLRHRHPVHVLPDHRGRYPHRGLVSRPGGPGFL